MILSKTSDAMKMRQVAVANELQRRGVGASMVRLAEEIAKNKHAKCMVLHARDTAIPFYLSMGYEIAGEGFMEVGIPHHAMRKSLVD
jgi:predicted GNAT family N-acyltransferase